MICGCDPDGKTASCHNCIFGQHCHEERCVHDDPSEEPSEPSEPSDDSSDDSSGDSSGDSSDDSSDEPSVPSVLSDEPVYCADSVYCEE